MIIVDCKTSISGQISQLSYLKLDQARITAKNYNFTFANSFAESAPLIRQDFLAREYLIGHDVLTTVGLLRSRFYQWPATTDTYCTMRQAINRAGLHDGKLPRLTELLAALEITPAAVDTWTAALYPDVTGAGPHDSRWTVAAVCCVLFVLAANHQDALPPELIEINDYTKARGSHFDPLNPKYYETEEFYKARRSEKNRRRYDGQVVTEQPTTAKQIIGSLRRYANPNNPANAYDAKDCLEHDRARELGHILPEPIRVSVREAIHSVAMECGPFTDAELADLERIASGEITVEQSIQAEYDKLEKMYDEHPEKFAGMPDFLKKKRRKNG